MTNKQRIRCLFGFHKFDIPYHGHRFMGEDMGDVRMCSVCKRVAKLMDHNQATIWQLDENEQPISWESANMYGNYIDGAWVSGRKGAKLKDSGENKNDPLK